MIIIKHDHNLMTINVLRKIVGLAFASGLGMFESTSEDGTLRKYYKGSIHPDSMKSILNTVNTLPLKQMEIAGVIFKETVNIDPLILFGRNSDPLNTMTFYVTENGDIVG